MILVTLGTQDKEFPRLLQAIEKQIEKGNIKEDVIVQAGCTKFTSKYMKIEKTISVMKSWSVVLLLFCSANLSACSGGNNNGDEGNGSGELPAGNVTVKITPDKKTVLRNPLNGWVIYMGRGWDENFWTTEGYDNVSVPELAEPVKVSDYASTCYIRTSWSSLEPEEGKYIWKDPTARLTRLLKSVLDRGMRLSFRIVVDGRDQGLNTPQYVFDAGAHWYKDPGPTNEATALARKSPFPDDKIFQEKYTKFIEALAQEFNDPDKVDFIDAYGLGKWGEAHTMIYEDHSKKKQVFEWITDLYSRCFTKVPLVINYHRLIGAENTSGWGALDPETEGLLESAINKGYSLRHDAFGMNGYYQDWEKQFAARWNYKRPIIMEGGWIVSQHRYWLDPMGYREGHPEDVRQGEFDASAEARVNMMDFRAGSETMSWFKCFGLVQRFVTEGGYRLYPDMVSLPKDVKSGEKITIVHRWNNMGWGYCPTNIPQWNQRYKVAFALLDDKNEVKKVFVDTQTDLSTWLKNKPTTYNFDLTLKGVSVGAYKWAVGLVDTTKDNTIGLRMAVKNNLLDSGWVKLMDITVK